ncbi:ParB N-terminal domain-containing protein [Brevundimonas sp.]|uniref:ParB/RepB/Spo0J family partition protein n=1 Tax=Brevundimonas sp. TaxID=1871086 RepID=UPI0025C67C2B|nr:ParB N-terminal domain-containing protein [Brevundimonas sp.]MCG2663369.1 ParB N-terminal domain-containing protein [Brevundimonas sp.]
MAREENTPAVVAAVLDPVAVDQIVIVPLDLIDATDRLREVDEAYATVLAGAFAGRGGQRTPIEIVRRGDRFRLVFGAHRYRAAQIAQLPGIKAIITEADDAELRLREIDENLIRNELSALDRARFLAERKRLYEALNPETKHGANRFTRDANLATLSFGADIAEKTGLSERTVQRAVALAEALSPEVVKALQHTPLARNQAALEALSKHPAKRQEAAVAHLLAAENPAKSVNEAFDRIDGRAIRPADEKHLSKAIDLWGRMPAKDRRAFLGFLAEAELRKGCTVEVGQ